MKKQVNELNLQRAKALLGGEEINEESLKKLLERIKVFCKVSYQLYLNSNTPYKPPIIKKLDAEPPSEFTNAA